MARIGSLTLAAGLLLVGPAASLAQSPWLGSHGTPRVAIEVYKPGFDEQSEFKSASTALFLSGRLRGNETVALVGELPMAFGGLRQDSDASAELGNPYLGLELGRPERGVWLQLGGRLPLVGEDPSSSILVGVASDIDRYSAFMSKTAALSGALNLGIRDSSGLGFRVRGGPELLISTRSGSDTETFMYYGAEVSHVRGPLEVSLHAGGIWVATESGSFSERSLHQGGVSASYSLGGVRPGITLRLPLDKDMTETLDYIVGLTLQVPLR